MRHVPRVDSKPAGLTHTHMIMTCILCSEGDQMLQVFRCLATVEHRAEQWRGSWGGGASAVFYYITANGTESNLYLSGRESTLCLRVLSISQTV